MTQSIFNDVDDALREKLDMFGNARRTGIIRIEITIGPEGPTGMNVETKENRQLKKQRERFAV